MRFLTNVPIVVALAATGCATLQTNEGTDQIRAEIHGKGSAGRIHGARGTGGEPPQVPDPR